MTNYEYKGWNAHISVSNGYCYTFENWLFLENLLGLSINNKDEVFVSWIFVETEEAHKNFEKCFQETFNRIEVTTFSRSLIDLGDFPEHMMNREPLWSSMEKLVRIF